MHQYKHIIQKMALAGVLLLVIGIENITPSIHTVYAQGTFGGTSTRTILNTFAETGAFFANGMEMLALMAFHYLQYFLDPLFILGLTKTAGLNNLWKYSRDIMNVLFAFMLIGAGIYTVVTGKKEVVQERYKKFILAVILVNFSWFFPRVILDVANVLTATVYQLPSGLSGNRVECNLPKPVGQQTAPKCKIITSIKYFTGCPAKDHIDKGFVCYQQKDWDSSTNTAFGMLNGLVINYGRLTELTRVLNPAQLQNNQNNNAGNNQLEQIILLAMHILFVLVLMAMLFLPLAAMLVVFLIRIPIIWVTIAFMPFMFLGFVAGDKIPKVDTSIIFKKFLGAAFLPTVIAVPFSAGFLILTELTQIDCKQAVPAFAQTICNNTGPLIHNVNSMWGLLMLLIGFIIIWVGFWFAVSIDPIYEKATAGIKNLGESVGKTALKIPLSAPILPIGGGTSVLGLDNAINRVKNSLSEGRGPLESIGRGFSSGSGNAGSGNNTRTTNATIDGKTLNEALQNPKGAIPVLLKDLKDEFSELRDENGDGKISTEELKKFLTEARLDQIKSKAGALGVNTTNLDQDSFINAIKNNKAQFDGINFDL